MKNIILDTNIFLNFYRLDSGQSLEMLKNLNKILRDDKFQLILPRQIEDEFVRQKYSEASISRDHIENFKKGLEVKFTVPNLIKKSPVINKISKTIKKLNALRKSAAKDYESRVFNPRSKINLQLKKLFDLAIRPIESDNILQRAWFRNQKGNPPRKNNSTFGDAIIWETILDHCTNDDSILISGDGDFESEIICGEIHELLIRDWKEKSKKELKLYKELGSFINEYVEKKVKPIKKETIEEESRLNSIYSTYPRIGALSIGEINRITDQNTMFTGSLGVSGINSSIVAGISSPTGYTGYINNMRICSKCGKSFFRGITSIYIDDGVCDDCKQNGGLGVSVLPNGL